MDLLPGRGPPGLFCRVAAACQVTHPIWRTLGPLAGVGFALVTSGWPRSYMTSSRWRNVRANALPGVQGSSGCELQYLFLLGGWPARSRPRSPSCMILGVVRNRFDVCRA